MANIRALPAPQHTDGRPLLPFGTEIRTRNAFENLICTGGTGGDFHVPLVTLVYGGGEGTIYTVLENARHRFPIICLEGSGRFCHVMQLFVGYYDPNLPDVKWTTRDKTTTSPGSDAGERSACLSF